MQLDLVFPRQAFGGHNATTSRGVGSPERRGACLFVPFCVPCGASFKAPHGTSAPTLVHKSHAQNYRPTKKPPIKHPHARNITQGSDQRTQFGSLFFVSCLFFSSSPTLFLSDSLSLSPSSPLFLFLCPFLLVPFSSWPFALSSCVFLLNSEDDENEDADLMRMRMRLTMRKMRKMSQVMS